MAFPRWGVVRLGQGRGGRGYGHTRRGQVCGGVARAPDSRRAVGREAAGGGGGRGVAEGRTRRITRSPGLGRRPAQLKGGWVRREFLFDCLTTFSFGKAGCGLGPSDVMGSPPSPAPLQRPGGLLEDRGEEEEEEED